MSTIKPKRPRVAFNRVVQSLSELYDMTYYEVLKVYQNQDKNIEHTKMILNLKKKSYEITIA